MKRLFSQFFVSSAMKKTGTILLFWIIAVLGVGYTYNFAIEFSAFAFSFAAVTMGITLVYVIDVTLIPEFDTFLEIRNGNTAAALYLLSVCILVGLSLLAAR